MVRNITLSLHCICSGCICRGYEVGFTLCFVKQIFTLCCVQCIYTGCISRGLEVQRIYTSWLYLMYLKLLYLHCIQCMYTGCIYRGLGVASKKLIVCQGSHLGGKKSLNSTSSTTSPSSNQNQNMGRSFWVSDDEVGASEFEGRIAIKSGPVLTPTINNICIDHEKVKNWVAGRMRQR